MFTATQPAHRIAAAPEGGTPIGWIPPVRWQPNQRIAVRGDRAWFQPSPGAGLVEFHRIEEIEYIWEEVYGEIYRVVGAQSRSVWVNPRGNRYPSVSAAVNAWGCRNGGRSAYLNWSGW